MKLKKSLIKIFFLCFCIPISLQAANPNQDHTVFKVSKDTYKKAGEYTGDTYYTLNKITKTQTKGKQPSVSELLSIIDACKQKKSGKNKKTKISLETDQIASFFHMNLRGCDFYYFSMQDNEDSQAISDIFVLDKNDFFKVTKNTTPAWYDNDSGKFRQYAFENEKPVTDLYTAAIASLLIHFSNLIKYRYSDKIVMKIDSMSESIKTAIKKATGQTTAISSYDFAFRPVFEEENSGGKRLSGKAKVQGTLAHLAVEQLSMKEVINESIFIRDVKQSCEESEGSVQYKEFFTTDEIIISQIDYERPVLARNSLPGFRLPISKTQGASVVGLIIVTVVVVTWYVYDHQPAKAKRSKKRISTRRRH